VAGCLVGDCLYTAESEFMITHRGSIPPSRPDGFMTGLLRGGGYTVGSGGVTPKYLGSEAGATVLIGAIDDETSRRLDTALLITLGLA
jgi:hypothetical protein